MNTDQIIRSVFISVNRWLISYSPTYGNRAMNRARLIAVAQARWNAAQLPERLRLKSLPWLVHIFFRPCTSL